MSDGAPKSAYELAMERLRKKDADAGIETRPLTGEQKAQIADIRQIATAKIAERKILHQSSILRTLDPGERQQLEDDLRRDLQRIEDDRERKIEKIRQSSD